MSLDRKVPQMSRSLGNSPAASRMKSWFAPGGVVKRSVAGKPLSEMKSRVRRITARKTGRSIEQVSEELRRYLVGWREYFRLAQTPGVFSELDQWLRHRLRALHLNTGDMVE